MFWRYVALPSLFLSLVLALTPRSTPSVLLIGVCLLSLSAFFAADGIKSKNAALLWFVLSRLAFLIAPPLLSDDYFRFIWDAENVLRGYSPYAYLPSELEASSAWLQSLFNQMNSPNYYSVYPPFMQTLFLLSIYGLGFLEPYFALKLVFFCLEVLLFQFVYRRCTQANLSQKRFFFLMLSPLVILEGLGNLHYEVLMVLIALSAYVIWKKNKKWSNVVSSSLFALAVLTKLTILPFILLFYQNFIKYTKFILIFSLSLILVSIPFIDEKSLNIFKSFDLYFGTFEFNASVFYLIRSLSWEYLGYNIIGDYSKVFALLLVLIALVGVFLCLIPSVKNKSRKILKVLQLFFVVYCLGNPTLHPWYLIVPMFFYVLGGSVLWIYWSVLIFFSYFFYQDYQQISWWLYTEYTLLGMAIFVENQFKLSEKLKHYLRMLQG